MIADRVIAIAAIYATILTLVVAYQTVLLQWLLSTASRFTRDHGQDTWGRLRLLLWSVAAIVGISAVSAF